MDKEKKEKIVAIVITTLISLVVSVIACLLGVSPDALNTYMSDSGTVADSAIVCMADII